MLENTKGAHYQCLGGKAVFVLLTFLWISALLWLRHSSLARMSCRVSRANMSWRFSSLGMAVAQAAWPNLFRSCSICFCIPEFVINKIKQKYNSLMNPSLFLCCPFFKLKHPFSTAWSSIGSLGIQLKSRPITAHGPPHQATCYIAWSRLLL